MQDHRSGKREHVNKTFLAVLCTFLVAVLTYETHAYKNPDDGLTLTKNPKE